MKNEKSKNDFVSDNRIERPMSWVGELSDSDVKQVCKSPFIWSNLIRLVVG